MGLIGFSKDVEKSLLEATSPFVFSTVNERSILRLLRLIACDNGKIGTNTKLVDDRNETAHPNGHIFFRTQAALVRSPRPIPGLLVDGTDLPDCQSCQKRDLIFLSR